MDSMNLLCSLYAQTATADRAAYVAAVKESTTARDFKIFLARTAGR
jgi:hypothetical protein